MNPFNVLVNAISCVDLEPDKAVAVLERLIAYRDVQVDDFNRISYALMDAHERIAELNAENSDLTAKMCELQRELEKSKRPTITMNMGRMFDVADEMSEKFISYVKWVRSEGAVMSHGGRIGLYEARFIAEYVFAYFNYRNLDFTPSRGEEVFDIDWLSGRSELADAIEALLKFNYPAYDIVWA